MISFLWFFVVPVCGSCILKPSGTGPVRGPSKKGNRTETGPDFKALSLGSADSYNSESPERLHIEFVKEAYHASNKQDYIEQMAIWLQR